MCRTSVRPGKTKSDNLNLFYATIYRSQLFCLGLQIWISEMLQYHPELEVVELVQDGPRFF